jgi:hypothetical protein
MIFKKEPTQSTLIVKTKISPDEDGLRPLTLYSNHFQVKVEEKTAFQVQKFKIAIAPDVSPDSQVFQQLFSKKTNTCPEPD